MWQDTKQEIKMHIRIILWKLRIVDPMWQCLYQLQQRRYIRIKIVIQEIFDCYIIGDTFICSEITFQSSVDTISELYFTWHIRKAIIILIRFYKLTMIDQGISRTDTLWRCLFLDRSHYRSNSQWTVNAIGPCTALSAQIISLSSCIENSITSDRRSRLYKIYSWHVLFFWTWSNINIPSISIPTWRCKCSSLV